MPPCVPLSTEGDSVLFISSLAELIVIEVDISTKPEQSACVGNAREEQPVVHYRY